jgi:hypothetical protein
MTCGGCGAWNNDHGKPDRDAEGCAALGPLCVTINKTKV